MQNDAFWRQSLRFRSGYCSLLLLLAAGRIFAPTAVEGQQRKTTNTAPTTAPTTANPALPDPSLTMNGINSRTWHGIDDPDMGSETDSMRARREIARKVQRKERLVASANHLVELTKQFQAEVSDHPVLTAEDQKRLDDIAKMAREVRSRMAE